jgi:hypothetical protein
MLRTLSVLFAALLFVGCSDSKSKKDDLLSQLNGADDISRSDVSLLMSKAWCEHFTGEDKAGKLHTAYTRYFFYVDGDLSVAQGERTGEGLSAIYDKPLANISARWGMTGNIITLANKRYRTKGILKVQDQNTIHFSEDLSDSDSKSWWVWYACP